MDSILSEIDEDVRRERFLQFWKKHGKLIVGLAVLAVVAAGGFRVWQGQRDFQLSQATAQLADTLQSLTSTNQLEVVGKLAKLAETAPAGFGWIARFYQANVLSQAGKPDEAGPLYAQVVADAGTPAIYRDLAKVLGANIAAAKKENAETIKSQLAPLAAEGQPWRNAARELLGTLALRAENRDEAKRWFQAVADDTEAPATQRQRAKEILTEIKS